MLSRVLLLAGLCVPGIARAQEKVQIEPREPWTNVFADSKLTCRYALKVPAGFQGRVLWAYTDAHQRVLPRGRGEAALPADRQVSVALTFPHVNAGVVLKTG